MKYLPSFNYIVVVAIIAQGSFPRRASSYQGTRAAYGDFNLPTSTSGPIIEYWFELLPGDSVLLSCLHHWSGPLNSPEQAFGLSPTGTHWGYQFLNRSSQFHWISLLTHSAPYQECLYSSLSAAKNAFEIAGLSNSFEYTSIAARLVTFASTESTHFARCLVA